MCKFARVSYIALVKGIGSARVSYHITLVGVER